MMKINHRSKFLGKMSFFLCVFLVGCGSQVGQSTKNEVASETIQYPTKDEETGSSMTEASDLENSEVALDGKDETMPNINTEVGYNRKIIKNGEMSLQTKEFKKCIEELTESIQSLGGYIESSNIEGNDFYSRGNHLRNAYLSIRIPQAQFDTFMNKGSSFGNVVNTSSSSEDITSQYVDTETRLKVLRTRHERLLALLEQTGELKDLFEIEKEIGEVTYEIESLSGTLQHYDSMVNMSTIQINIEEVKTLTDTKQVVSFKDELQASFMSSCRSLIQLMRQGVMLLVMAIPYVMIALPIALILELVRRHYKKKGKKDN